MGHKRLSIIDVSTAGRQPMQTRDGRYTLNYNGKIYNYRELRTELESLEWEFSTRTDTEVLLAAWAQWGNAVLRRLIGMFAFVVHDRIENTLTCIRDPFGIKPLFYSAQNDRFVIAYLSRIHARHRSGRYP